MFRPKTPSVAIVHDYLFQYGGGEKVIEKWLEMYPQATVYTSFFVKEKFSSSPVFVGKVGQIKTTWISKILNLSLSGGQKPLLKFQKHLFWLYPLVMSFVWVKNYDLVLISSTYCAKNVRLQNCRKIVHYCHSPTRFLHGLMTETDHQSLSKVYRLLIPFFAWWLKILDLRAVKYLQKKGCIWIANSLFIQETIKQVYKVDSQVIYPPIELDKFLKIGRKNP